MKYEGPLRVRYVGSEQAGKRYLHRARVLVGELIEDAAVNNLGVLSRFRDLPDGTRITAELLGRLREVTVDTTRTRERRRPREINDFVVTPRTGSLPSGIDADHPELVLQREPESTEWKTYFRDASTPQFQAFTRPKATYQPVFYRGLGRAGNVDWLGPEGERISWHGPACRMFAHAYVQPARMYGRKVYMLGEPILDTAQYDEQSNITTAATHVLGAALKVIDNVTYLLTVQSSATDTTTPPPSTTDALFSFPLSQQTAPGGMYVYRLAQITDDAGIIRFRAAPSSRVRLLEIQTGGCEPWFFNRSATEATCVPFAALTVPSAPGASIWTSSMEAEVDPPDPASGFVESYPAVSNARVFATIDGVAGATLFASTLAVTVGGGAAAFAVDYVADSPVAVGARITSAGDVIFATGQFETPLYKRTVVSGEDIDFDKRWILYGNIRDNVFVFQVAKAQFRSGVRSGTLSVEVYRGGVKVLDTVTSDIDAQQVVLPAAASLRAYSAAKLSARTIAPLFFVYGLMTYKKGNPLLDPTDPEYLSNIDTLYVGANITYGMRAYPAECYFGLADNTAVASRECGGFSGNRADDEGFFSTTGVAATSDYCMLSTAYNVGGMGASIYWTNTDTLPALTGVDGAQVRYHPAWLLGAVPLAEFIPEPGDPR